MPHLNGKGPEVKGPKTGRKLGKCSKTPEEIVTMGTIGQGMGLKRNSGGGQGKGRRIKNSINTKYWINENENCGAGKK